MKRIVLSVLVLVFPLVLTGGSFAEEIPAPTQCITVPEAMRRVTAADPSLDWKILNGAAAQNIAAAYNALPPPIELRADVVVIFGKTGGDRFRFLFFQDGCFTGYVVTTVSGAALIAPDVTF